ncbi:8-oxo-dGTP diphosphatase MutT [Acetobacter fallax]|uniref:8-oxo-dGTP diphosphatase n=1 Tax=Acetobacter fallax TaxID=1737473 RepID=A0ABX0K667_9PROT|nr:8-oxo-dGTP diphosphatase MutT [Acetobacter fallax]NHO31242.1 8-oxo-dGTP diphosphatase MutT [Acetobacter fallax]NHO34799.1 8-oxo-dGTP diphosphatase MutT [Acetobacter fallax]
MSGGSYKNTGTPVLTAGAYTLRGLLPEDANAIHRQVNDWNVIRMLSRLPFPYPHELAVDWIAGTARQADEGTAWHFAIIDPAGSLVGCVGLTLHQGGRRASLGYWIGRNHWGRGIASLAADRVCRWALANLPLDGLEAKTAQDNIASAAVLRRVGFRQTGTATMPFMARGGDIPVLTFEAVRSDFDAVHEAVAETDAPASPSGVTGRRVLLVVAAALIDSDGRVLLARRPEGKSLAGLWEFPGGKIDAGETPETALIRELNEELGIDVTRACLAPFTFVSHAYEKFDLLMPLWLCRRWHGTPQGREGQALAWVRADDLEKYPMPPADLPLIPFLRDLL